MLTKMVAKGAARQAMKIGDAPNEEQMSRAERVGNAWRVSDDALWNPFEVIAFVVNIIFVFGFFLGQSHYLFVAELFFPVILIAICVLIFQATLRWRAGENGALRVMRDRLG